MQFSINLESFDQVAFVEEKETAEKNGFRKLDYCMGTNLKISELKVPNYSDYYLLVKIIQYK
ncbi:hypothetical protein [Halobacillus seohaensis]|uniref:Uncharacterized protein n=1 Tax=Halobacillus seohaensis TaxID=447421 RepID=A0ABW2EL99_9BACI